MSRNCARVVCNNLFDSRRCEMNVRKQQEMPAVTPFLEVESVWGILQRKESPTLHDWQAKQ
eukprot:6408798-Amphidinium_carterae.1